MNFSDTSRDEALRETLIDGKTIHKGRIVHLQEWEARLPNGKTAGREIVRHVGAAAVAAVDEEGRILLVRQYRAPINDMLWEIPAGKLDAKDEPNLAAAQRELEEETGYVAKNWTLLTDMITTPGFCDEHIGLYLATDLVKTQTHPDEDEFLISVWAPLDEAIAAIATGEIRDAKTIAALLLAKEALK